MIAPEAPKEARHLIVIVGGAVAGSEAAALCAERGAMAVVLEQNNRPFGKIEDGLPRWHEKLQQKEYGKIAESLTKRGVVFVPCTTLGEHVSIEKLLGEWKPNALLLASGAWRDRPLPVAGADDYVGRGLLYQNPFVHWYNHYPDEDYDGPQYEVPDGAIVIGGGLASIDVVKIINFQLYKRALAERGIQVTTLELEHAGIPKTLEKHGLSVEQLGVQGVTLYYRRSKREMPLASPPPNATPKQQEKIGDVRAKLMDKVMEKYLVRFEGNHAPAAVLTEGDRMVGMRFQKTHTVDGKLVPLEGDTVDVKAPLVVSSIGSIPQAVPGLPMKGELIDFEDWDSGKVRGFDNVFGLGNALTGKGNIKESRKNAAEIAGQVLESYLGLVPHAGEPESAEAHAAARAAAEPAVDAAMAQTPRDTEQLQRVCSAIGEHWQRSGYDGRYEAWIEKVLPKGTE